MRQWILQLHVSKTRLYAFQVTWIGQMQVICSTKDDLNLIPCKISLLRLQFTEVIGALCAGSLQNVTHHQKGYKEQSIGHHSATLQTMVHLHPVSLVRLSRASPTFLLYSVGFTHCNLLYLSLSHFYCLTLVIVSREPHFACISWDSPEIKNFPLHILYYVIAPFCEKLK